MLSSGSKAMETVKSALRVNAKEKSGLPWAPQKKTHECKHAGGKRREAKGGRGRADGREEENPWFYSRHPLPSSSIPPSLRPPTATFPFPSSSQWQWKEEEGRHAMHTIFPLFAFSLLFLPPPPPPKPFIRKRWHQKQGEGRRGGLLSLASFPWYRSGGMVLEGREEEEEEEEGAFGTLWFFWEGEEEGSFRWKKSIGREHTTQPPLACFLLHGGGWVEALLWWWVVVVQPLLLLWRLSWKGDKEGGSKSRRKEGKGDPAKEKEGEEGGEGGGLDRSLVWSEEEEEEGASLSRGGRGTEGDPRSSLSTPKRRRPRKKTSPSVVLSISELERWLSERNSCVWEILPLWNRGGESFKKPFPYRESYLDIIPRPSCFVDRPPSRAGRLVRRKGGGKGNGNNTQWAVLLLRWVVESNISVFSWSYFRNFSFFAWSRISPGICFISSPCLFLPPTFGLVQRRKGGEQKSKCCFFPFCTGGKTRGMAKIFCFVAYSQAQKKSAAISGLPLAESISNHSQEMKMGLL